MAKNKIRLRYSGFILFTSKLLSVATGLAFVLMITWSVPKEEFGIWGNLSDVLGYFVLLAGVLPFWTTRFLAREHEGAARTGLIANMFISIASASIYFILLPTILSSLEIGADYTMLYTLITIQIIELYIISALDAVLFAKQPHTIGYGLLVYEICKVALGFTLIMHFRIGLLGAIYSIIGSYVIQIAFYMKRAAKEFRQSAKWTYLGEWLKASPINIYNIIGDRIASFTLIFLFVYGELARSYYGAALTIANVIAYSTFLSYALYPKLLARIDPRDVSTSLKMVLMPAVPMTIGAVILSDSYLAILSSEYIEARPILSILAIYVFCLALKNVLSTVVMGTERIDAKAKIPFRQLIRTRLFQIFTIPYIQSAVTLPTTFFMLFCVSSSQVAAATYLAVVNLIAGAATLAATYFIARKCLTFSFPWKSVAKYVIASAAMVGLLIVVPHPSKISSTLILTGVGGIMYFAVLTAIDMETRELVGSVLGEVKSRLGRTI